LLLRTDGGREVGVEEASELKRESDSVELLGTWWALMLLSISLAEKTYEVCIGKAEGVAGAVFLSSEKNDLIGRLTEVPMGSLVLAGATTN
jgi:hypothetical protein